jgi:hypothetical protein
MWYGAIRPRDNAEPFIAYVVNNLFGADHVVNNATADRHECVVLLRQASDTDLVIVEFINNTLAGNSTLRGITLDNENSSTPLELYCYNSILYWNTSSLTDFSIHDFRAGTPSASNLNVDYCNTEQGGFGGNNISDDPAFLAVDDFQLDGSSPCIDAGSEYSNPVQEEVGDDLDGNPRVQGEIDMGCYEY